MPDPVAIAWPFTNETWLTAATATGIAAVGGILIGRKSLHGTTLIAPAVWSVFSMTAVIAIEWLIFASGTDPSNQSTWRYLAAVSTLCPAMAVLGAKRPQDRGWQFIVLSLYLVLALPAAQALAFAPGGRLELHAAWQWFLVVLVAIGLVNHVPTRHCLSAFLVAAGQYFLLRDQWPIFAGDMSYRHTCLGIVLCASGLVIASRDWRAPHKALGWNRVWTDFRDSFGAVWAVRVADRINHSAHVNEWPVQLTWRGFDPNDDPESFTPEMELSIRTLLRRFVPPQWIDKRLNPAQQRGESSESRLDLD